MDLHTYPDPGPFIAEVHPSGNILHINRPYITACRRAIGYKTSGDPPLDNVPWLRETQAHVSKVLTPLILDAMKAQGWTIIAIPQTSSNSAHYSQWRPHPDLGLNAIPDAFGSHPTHTSGLKTTIITSWLPTPSSLPPADPRLLHMLTAFIKTHTKEPTVHPEAPAVLATLVLDPFRIDITTFTPTEAQQELRSLQDHLRPLSTFAKSPHNGAANVIPRDHQQSSPTCNGCPWRSTCRP